MGALAQTQKNVQTTKDVRNLASDVLIRINGWDVVTKLLQGADTDLNAAILWLKNFSEDEAVLGLFLSNILLLELPIPSPNSQPYLPELNLGFPSIRAGCASKDAFIAFLRVYFGVAALGLAFTWAVADQAESLYGRILSVFQIWQGESGYREVSATFQPHQFQNSA